MAGAWLGISSAELDSLCGEDVGHLLADALDGTDDWQHTESAAHWFILDLGETYRVTKVRGRSQSGVDPLDIDIYVSDVKGVWGDAVATGINTWQDTADWAEVSTTDKSGRYVYVVVNDCEGPLESMRWGILAAPDTIFDVYEGVPARKKRGRIIKPYMKVKVGH